MSSSSVAGGASTQGAVNSVVGSGASNIINTITTFLNSSNGRMVIFAVVFILIIIGVIQYIYTNNISPDITKFINNITGKSVMKYTCNNIQINAPNAENAAKTNLCKDKKVKTIDEYENAYKEMIPSWVNTILLSISHNNNA